MTETDANGHQTRTDWLYDDLGRLTREVYDRFDNDGAQNERAKRARKTGQNYFLFVEE